MQVPTNLSLPGNPRYQPRSLVPAFGYDNLAGESVRVETATMRTLAEFGFIPERHMALLTPEIEEELLRIRTSLVDLIEKSDTPEYGLKTRHDVRALIRAMIKIIPKPLRRWVHPPNTSYDVLDTARMLQFIRAHDDVVRPKTRQVITCFRGQAMKYAEQVQIGRTHGKHALPITVGFWFATILSRVLFNISHADMFRDGLVGKISGAVGAGNAQVGLMIDKDRKGAFERRVLERLGLKPARISTQILPPEPLSYYLFSCLMLSAALGQFGRDGRNLMRSEIGEIAEPFEVGQSGSSTMANKRNPANFEGVEGKFWKNKNEFGKVLDTLISEHQRDLVGSALMRDFPTLIVNLVTQLDILLRAEKGQEPFLSRIAVDTEACRRNLGLEGDSILAEPFYLALQIHGYEGDAHAVMNTQAMALRSRHGWSLFEAVEHLTQDDHELGAAWKAIPDDIRNMFRDPSTYVGRAAEKTREICALADAYLTT